MTPNLRLSVINRPKVNLILSARKWLTCAGGTI